jgi:hypothetical protein
VSYAAIIKLWVVALPGFLIISSVSVVVNVMSLRFASNCLFIYFRFCGSGYNSSVNPDYKYKITVSLCILESTATRGSRITYIWTGFGNSADPVLNVYG